MAIEEEKAVQVERDILDHLEAVKKEKGLTDESWGELAFAGTVNGRRKIQNLKKPQANGRPQRLSVGDFVRLCYPLGVDPTRILGKVLDEHKL